MALRVWWMSQRKRRLVVRTRNTPGVYGAVTLPIPQWCYPPLTPSSNHSDAARSSLLMVCTDLPLAIRKTIAFECGHLCGGSGFRANR